ncbi:phospholipase D1 [Paracoccidioides lutzii Pb01]|uniref:Phospholipase D1 n=1 Tax=Paracoccidioides lutzii (strain ATCC MYA-826 / Pb01) TaxID=502779 RepID=C1HDK8_PARBA|nr:phospholipase D1 [Paracoccidioides lutzii Pb01]EEH39580.2 phospholipase D1 [Paracoccidioides lutzii Pb01]
MGESSTPSMSEEPPRTSSLRRSNIPEKLKLTVPDGSSPKVVSLPQPPNDEQRESSSSAPTRSDLNGSNGAYVIRRKPVVLGPAFEPSRSTPSERNIENAAESHIQDRQGDTVIQPKPSPVPSRNPSGRSSKTKQKKAPGFSTPQGRRSVQFARTASGNEDEGEEQGEGDGVPHSQASSIGPEDGDLLSKDRRLHSSLFSKLKAFAASPSFPTHNRTASGMTIGDEPMEPRPLGGTASPRSERGEFHFPNTLEEEGSEMDADAESSSGEQAAGIRKKKRKIRRPPATGSRTAPSTPKSSIRPQFPSRGSFTPGDSFRGGHFSRRADTNAVPPQVREGFSEDEGRERLKRDNMWRRRNGWLQSARGLSYSGPSRPEGRGSQDEKRHSNFRRLAGFGGQSDNPDGIAASWRRHKGERGTSLSAQKWRQIKAGLKMIGQRKKVETTVDHVKSAELLAELASGIPAALLLASMFQRDEHGSRRIPILLEQLKVHITDSKFDPHSNDRHLVFRIELEYGSGMTRMKWVIHRTLRDFANLHIKYKLQIGTQRYIQLKAHDTTHPLPHFPRSAFPYLRGVRDLESEGEEEADDVGDETAAEGTSGNERAHKKKKRRSSFGISRRQSSLTAPAESGASGALEPGVVRPASIGGGAVKRESYPERQRKKLEIYLQQMIRFLIFRPDSNRLCKFLELSALGVRLAAEGSYHGKEGFLVIQSSKGLDFRRALNPSMIKSRHSPKWFLVRHSYVVCVDSPEGMNIYDVFLVDPFFQIQPQKVRLRDQKPKQLAQSAKESAAHPQHHTLKLQNSERKLRLLARNERQLHQFEDSIRFMVDNTPWSKPNRFDSFAPVRQNCFAQWLVDGRDYMWVVSRAINQAKDVIYIHDWWLSPELYMRRPAAISQKWRLDRLLQRKAQEGVKVFVIMYRNINSAIPIDSEYSKFSLLDLHPNIFVQRSPNQFRQNTFFWAHHEKLCLVDHTLAFIGGIDLCFGRWDTPQHLVTDDKLTGFELTDVPKDADHCQLWPGKDYSNPRIQDFYDLDKPYEEMYDREVVPRMPWHDISMHIVGQPARDLTRHFVQRWNYILRQRKPTRPTPFLLPPPDFNPADLESLGLDGTCEVQILRSSSTWSTGTSDVTEHSIMNAYLKMIELSDHFVYIENQFFVTSCEIEGKKIENRIGDALVERIIRAARNDEDWRAVILIPLMPGFQNQVDTEGGTSVRLIMQCQYRSICRGETSIFGRLRAAGIEPEDYIQFFSLRSWGKIGPRKLLVTEQLYIHAKCMVVDDRVAIIGSANINERSMLGSRDSECAAIVRDTDLLWSTMGGKPYLVGRFSHTLRMRLMREHIGIDVDEIMEQAVELDNEMAKSNGQAEPNIPHNYSDEMLDHGYDEATEKRDERELLERRHRIQDEFLARSEELHSFNHDVDWEQANNPNLKSNKKLTEDSRIMRNEDHKKDLEGLGVDQMKLIQEAGQGDGRDSFMVDDRVEVLAQGSSVDGKPGRGKSKLRKVSPSQIGGEQNKSEDVPPPTANSFGRSVSSSRPTTQPAPHDFPTNVDHHSQHDAQDYSGDTHPLSSDINRPIVDKDCMRDPLSDTFYLDIWQTIAENNTKLYRSVFRCMPDNEVKTWKEYKEYTAYAERFADMQNSQYYKNVKTHPEATAQSGPPGNSGVAGSTLGKVGDGLKEKITGTVSNEATAQAELKHWASEANKAQIEREQLELSQQETGISMGEKDPLKATETKSTNSSYNVDGTVQSIPETEKSPQKPADGSLQPNATQLQRRRRRATTRSSRREFHASDDIISKAEAEELMNSVQGHLIVWPYEWLVAFLRIQKQRAHCRFWAKRGKLTSGYGV